MKKLTSEPYDEWAKLNVELLKQLKDAEDTLFELGKQIKKNGVCDPELIRKYFERVARNRLAPVL